MKYLPDFIVLMNSSRIRKLYLKYLGRKNINLSKCKGQGCNGANVMSGVYNGL